VRAVGIRCRKGADTRREPAVAAVVADAIEEQRPERAGLAAWR
jgi:hypothetical protein